MVTRCVGGGGGITRHLLVAGREELCMLDEMGMGVMVLFWITRAFKNQLH